MYQQANIRADIYAPTLESNIDIYLGSMGVQSRVATTKPSKPSVLQADVLASEHVLRRRKNACRAVTIIVDQNIKTKNTDLHHD